MNLAFITFVSIFMPFKLSKSIILTLIGVFFVLDRFLKMLVVVKIKAIEIIPNFFQIVFYPNTKGPFSLPIPLAVTIIISALLIIILLILIMRPPQFILRATPTSSRGSREVRSESETVLDSTPFRSNRILFDRAKRVEKFSTGSNDIRFVLILITVGAASNLFDRIFYGYTIDTFQFSNFSFFNLSDGLIFAGIILLILKLGVLPLGRD